MLFTKSDHETGLTGWKKPGGVIEQKERICLIARPTQILFEHQICRRLFPLLIRSEQYLTVGGRLLEIGSGSKSAGGELGHRCERWRIRIVLDHIAQPRY